jgi:hypothetical protein
MPFGFGPRRLASFPAEVKNVLARLPYRCAVGVMIKTDEVSEQLCGVKEVLAVCAHCCRCARLQKVVGDNPTMADASFMVM